MSLERRSRADRESGAAEAQAGDDGGYRQLSVRLRLPVRVELWAKGVREIWWELEEEHVVRFYQGEEGEATVQVRAEGIGWVLPEEAEQRPPASD